ncbi:MAG: hypothetical protein QHH06_11660 [Clostridiales bacterium]|jgi:hypothetical protein|nr:hypothetical protein [Eubacteriales bacterium]MDH7567117.1 hypothetical protein [Clostridiales bacterium]
MHTKKAVKVYFVRYTIDREAFSMTGWISFIESIVKLLTAVVSFYLAIRSGMQSKIPKSP